MSRPANPYDNATCESFLKTLKREEINARTYRDFAQLEEGVREFIEQHCNRLRLHSALSYRSPEEFEKHVAAKAVPCESQGANGDVSECANDAFGCLTNGSEDFSDHRQGCAEHICLNEGFISHNLRHRAAESLAAERGEHVPREQPLRDVCRGAWPGAASLTGASLVAHRSQ
jgi:Integrase core domain